MAKRIMSEAEQKRRQKLQSQIGRTTSTMGLSALGVTGTAALAAKKPGVLNAIRKVPGLKKATVKGMEGAAIKSGIVSGGIGGVGGFNQASIYSAESRRRKQAVPVKKNLGLEMGYYGEEGHPLTHEQIEAEIEKAWTPSASNFDAERGRHKRAKAYEGGALVGAGAGGAYAAHQGMKAVHAARGLKTTDAAPVSRGVREYTNKKGTKVTQNVKSYGKTFRALDVVEGKKALAHGGKAAAGLAAVAGAAATHSAIKRKQAGGWQSYAKRDSTSAFGVDHNDEVSKVNVKPLMGSLAPMGALEHVGHVGAGGKTASRALAAGMPNHGPRNALLARGQAKVQGQRAAKQLAQGGKTQATESANLGWRSKAVAHRGLTQPAGKAPAGMRGPIGSRVQTSAMKRKNSAFL